MGQSHIKTNMKYKLMWDKPLCLIILTPQLLIRKFLLTIVLPHKYRKSTLEDNMNDEQ